VFILDGNSEKTRTMAASGGKKTVITMPQAAVVSPGRRGTYWTRCNQALKMGNLRQSNDKIEVFSMKLKPRPAAKLDRSIVGTPPSLSLLQIHKLVTGCKRSDGLRLAWCLLQEIDEWVDQLRPNGR
jgi:hypothetical protein